jgi:hypothetical protein
VLRQPGREGRVCRDLVLTDGIGRRGNESLAHHLRVLLVAAPEADHRPAGRMLDDFVEALTHQFLERHSLLNDRGTAPALEQCLLDP